MHDLGVAGQCCGADLGGLVPHALHDVVRRVDHAAGRGVRNHLQDNQIPEALQQVGAEAAWVVPGVDHRLDGAEERRAVAGGQRVDGPVDQREVGGAQQRQRPLVDDAILLGAGQQLVEHRQRVTRRTTTGADDQGVHRVVDADVLLGADLLQQAAHGLRRQQPERVVMGTRPDGRQHLLRLGGGEHEDQVLRRLLDDLEQRVETGVGHHVRFVDDEDAVPRLRRRVERAVPELTGVVDTTVAGGVEFDDVDVARPVRRERHARMALAARIGRRPLLTVQRAGQDARRRRLATTARPGEQVGMVDPARFERVAQRLGDMLLPDYLSETCRSVLAVESHGRRLPSGSDSCSGAR
ncbi:Uncharacterised protein [Mycobacteroides abscessus subsp. abscessus]|nr:Uncharacterised protein [Mycobacteroides abscessus subsp. abscessus]